MPVPWEDFKLTPKANLLVLDATRNTVSAAPHVTYDQSVTTEEFNQQSRRPTP
jgi:hypothetical protein